MSLWKKITGHSWASARGYVGMAAGALIGYMVGGPAGAMVGAGIGYGATAETPKVETPKNNSVTAAGDVSAGTPVAQADAAGDAAANEERRKLKDSASRGRAGTVLTSRNSLGGGGNAAL